MDCFKDKLMKVYRGLMSVCYAVAVSWLCYIGCGGVIGVVISSALTLVALFFMYRNPMKESELRYSLLTSVLLIWIGVGLILKYPRGAVSGVAVWLAGAVDICFWLSLRKFEGKSFVTILKEEFRLQPPFDLALIILWTIEAIEVKDIGGPADWLILAFLLFDFIRQVLGKFMKKPHTDMHTLKNDILTVRVKGHGAELASIKKGSKEYLWQAEPPFWNRQSPILFPIVGSVWEGRYRVGDKEFTMGQHGFARDMDFTLMSGNDEEVRYCLTSDEETLKKYPWRFALEIAYRLRGNKLDVIWNVKNLSNEDMYFQIGAHPAFYYPDYDPQTVERGYFSFDRSEGLQTVRLKEKGCVDAEKKYPFEVPQDGLFPITKDTFDEIDTIVLEDSQVGKVTLHRNDGTPWLALRFDAPVVGIWSPPTQNAPFVCIEPWYGRCDRAPFTGDYSEKDWINRLAEGETFSSVYTIEIL